ncbi:MAG: radical SAM protein [Planctomycetia bacterium]|nr:radical SAM protein [Planctomycetia bacterium]
MSIGINLSPHRLCNFHCVYCQVQGRVVGGDGVLSEKMPVVTRAVDMTLLRTELEQTARWVMDGTLFEVSPFSQVEPEHRHLKDFAFSGDGEPTFSPDFPDALEILVQVKKSLGFNPCKLVLITNATGLHVESVYKACDLLVSAGGEIWAKLDAGTPQWYNRINGSSVPYERIVENLDFAAHRWGIVVQTMLLQYDGQTMSEAQFDAYCQRLEQIIRSGGKIQRVQLYTVARTPVSPLACSLDDATMRSFQERLAKRTGLKVDVFFA